MKFSKEFKIGFFAIAVLVVSFFLINYLRGEDIFNREFEVVSTFENVEGLVPSAPVYIKGYKAGKVIGVAYNKIEGNFDVTCSISRDFRIPSDSYMTIYSVDIMGGKGVKIDLGSSATAAADGDILRPSFEAGLMDGLSSGVGPLLEKVTSTLDNLEYTVAGINKIMSEENTASIGRTLAHLERTISDVGSIAADINGKSSELNAFIGNLALVSEKFTTITDKIDTTMNNVSEVSATLSETDIEGLVVSFKALLEKVNDPDSSIGKLLTDGSVYNSLDELLNDVDSLVRKIEENPRKYIRISVF